MPSRSAEISPEGPGRGLDATIEDHEEDLNDVLQNLFLCISCYDLAYSCKGLRSEGCTESED